MDPEPPQMQIGLAYLALLLIWGSTPLAVVLSLHDLDAIWSLSLRMLLAAVLVTGVLRFSGQRLLWSREAMATYGIGALSMFGAMFFTYLGARHLPSGLISILFGSSPLIVGVLGVFLLPEARLKAVQWLGMLVGMAGLVRIFWKPEHGAGVDLLSVAYIMLGVFSYALSAVILRRRGSALPPLVQTTGSLWLSVLACAFCLPFFREQMPTQMPGLVSLSALLFSAVFGSIVAMLCYFFLIRQISATTVALVTLITPVFALCLGMLFNHERFRAETVTGMALLFAGLVAYYAQDIGRIWLARRQALAAD